MPLLLLDLDNTLIDRDAAFRAAVAAFLSAHGLPATDLSWVTAVDAGGYTPAMRSPPPSPTGTRTCCRRAPSASCSTPAPPTAWSWLRPPARHSTVRAAAAGPA
ncbi:hypothetical protein [Streptomyces scabiei]|uniref:hypothetical protein n=1 Tax=Streptomyces scabiei TaxID=1930 RepID=UPI001FF622E3|nr:hypothetical protein [Streptomyces sp. LBUM 1486]